jgi:hypothetical protein
VFYYVLAVAVDDDFTGGEVDSGGSRAVLGRLSGLRERSRDRASEDRRLVTELIHGNDGEGGPT